MSEMQPKDIRFSSDAVDRFRRRIGELPVPDIDKAREILPKAIIFYEGLGVPPQDARAVSEKLEANLDGGTALQQGIAYNALLSLQEGYQRFNIATK